MSNLRKRILQIDLMQGYAMTLVVLGHHLFTFLPAWYKDMHTYIYLFHMPFFLFISGFLIHYSYKGVSDIHEYISYIKRKARKFVPPFLIIGFIITCLRHYNEVYIIPSMLLQLLIEPLNSDATFLWYIYLLFLFYILSPLLFRISTKWLWGGLILAIILRFNPPGTDLFCLDYFFELSPFYLLGVLVSVYIDRIGILLNKWRCIGALALVVFIVLSVLYFRNEVKFLSYYILPWISIPAFAYLVWVIGKLTCVRIFLTFISYNCFGIYLLHLFFVQGFALLVSRWSGITYTGVAVTYLILSSIISMILAAICWKRLENFKWNVVSSQRK